MNIAISDFKLMLFFKNKTLPFSRIRFLIKLKDLFYCLDYLIDFWLQYFASTIYIFDAISRHLPQAHHLSRQFARQFVSVIGSMTAAEEEISKLPVPSSIILQTHRAIVEPLSLYNPAPLQARPTNRFFPPITGHYDYYFSFLFAGYYFLYTFSIKELLATM